MTIKCDNPYQVGISTLEPNFSSDYLVLDLVGAGLIGLTIDGINNALYEYPSFVTIGMSDDSSKKQSPNQVRQQFEEQKVKEITNDTSILQRVEKQKTKETETDTSSTTHSGNSQNSQKASSSLYSHSNGYFVGKRGGCYTYTSGGNKRYVAHSFCRN